MKISRHWLSDFIDWKERDPQIIADHLTRCMGEVDEVEIQGKYLDGCVVGKIESIEKHPGADRLSVCKIQSEAGGKNVVCGGTNLRPGMHVAFAHIGATVKAGQRESVTLQQVKIRGVDSEGMICAAEELELEHLFPVLPSDGNRPVIDLDRLTSDAARLTPGMPLRQALAMDDVIFHIDNHAITNRPDLFSHIGIARELVAMGIATWKKQPSLPKISLPKNAPAFTLKNEVPDLVPEYRGAVLTIDGAGQTPEWMKRRLEATGWRSINLVVDITNYVLMEIGMPLHAFDAGDFRGTLTIRKAKAGESITTLDGQHRALPEGAVVISDDEGIFDLFGVMGGLRTSNKPETTTIFVQAGVINPANLRKTMMAMGHRTDAATVYEKGVCLDTAHRGLLRAIELFLELAPTTKVIASIQWGKEEPKKPIAIPADKFSSFIGAPISTAEIKKIFTDLGFTLKTSGKNVSITPPRWRSDITMKQDLVEEVARIYGYANVTPVMPSASIAPPPRDHRLHRLSDCLAADGWYETLHLAFTHASALSRIGLDPADAVRLENPIGEELSLMRPSLVPSLLATIARESRSVTGTAHLKMYEIGATFHKNAPERLELCLMIAARNKDTLRQSPILLLKDHLSHALAAIGHPLTARQIDRAPAPFGHAGRSARLSCDHTDIGYLTELDPDIGDHFHLQRLAMAVVDLSTVLGLKPATVIAAPLPSFPAVTYDETFPVKGGKHGLNLGAAQRSNPLLCSIDTVDLYDSPTAQTITLRFTYRAHDRTLTQAEADAMHARVLQQLRQPTRIADTAA